MFSDRHSDSYEHRIKTYGRIQFPVLAITGWAEKEELSLAPNLNEPPDDFFEDFTP